MWKKWTSLSPSFRIFVGMVLGLIVGLAVGPVMGNFEFIGKMWMNALKISIAPLVLIMLILGIGRQDDPKRMGLVSVQLLAYYIFTTLLAGIVGILVANVTKAGVGFEILEAESEMEAAQMTFSKFFLSLIPDNFLAPLVNSTLMQVLILGVLCGIVVQNMKDTEARNTILKGCDSLQALFNGLLRLIIEVAPVGIFFYMASIAGTKGGSIVAYYGRFLGTLLLAFAVQIVVVYAVVVMLGLQGKNPVTYIKNMIPSWVIAFTTASSVLVVPSNTEIVEDKYGVDPAIANFGIPLGSVFNLDGAAIFFPVVIVFAAQAVGVNYSFGTLMYMAIVGTLVASSGGGVFGGALVKLLVMCELFAVPSSIVTMVAGIFAIVDMFITVVNISGDVAGTVLVDTLDKRRKARKA